MPTDFHFNVFGLVLLGLITVFAVLPFLFWRRILGKKYSEVGVRPYVTAYIVAMFGLLITQFILCYLEFNDRASADLVLEADRWSTIFGWTIFTFVICLAVVLPFLGFIAVPASAVLIRMRKFSLVNISICLIGSWILFSYLMWLFPMNEWGRTHRLESFLQCLHLLLPFFALVFSPFLLSVYITIGLRRRAARI